MTELISFFGAFLLFGSPILFWSLFILLIILFFVSEVNENGFVAFISFAIFCIVNHYYGKSHMFALFSVQNIVIYLILGFIHAVIRVYIKGVKARKTVDEMKEFIQDYNKQLQNLSEKEKEDRVIVTTIENHIKRHTDNIKDFKERQIDSIKSNVFRYWFLFPISLTVWLFNDLFKDVFDVLYKFVGNLFNQIFLLGLGDDNKQ